MAWVLTDTVNDTTVNVTPYAGKIRRNYTKPTAVFDVLRGGTRMVQHGPTRKGSVDVPAFRVTGTSALASLTTILGSGHRMTLLDDGGVTYTVQLAGEWQVDTEDLPDRDTSPIFTVSVKFIEVA